MTHPVEFQPGVDIENHGPDRQDIWMDGTEARDDMRAATAGILRTCEWPRRGDDPKETPRPGRGWGRGEQMNRNRVGGSVLIRFILRGGRHAATPRLPPPPPTTALPAACLAHPAGARSITAAVEG